MQVGRRAAEGSEEDTGETVQRGNQGKNGERVFILPLLFCVERVSKFTLEPKCEAFPQRSPVGYNLLHALDGICKS